jgi:pseudouridine-5'-phosphate glycosidase
VTILVVSAEVEEALAAGRPVVALETTIVAHGFPAGEGFAVGKECERRIRDGGGVPATVGILDGNVHVGLDEGQLTRIAEAGTEARKVSPRDLAACVADGALGATTVGGTLVAARAAGVRVMATGGIGGVHRGYASRPDVSADLPELARTRAVVVCSGVKSLLDVPATLELLETLGIPVVGYGTDTVPLFYSAAGGPPAPVRRDTAADVATLAKTHWELGGHGVLLTRGPDPELPDVEPLIGLSLAAARTEGVTGQQVTPFVLAYLHEQSGGQTLEVNRRLAADNAGLAVEVAAAL